MATKGKTERGVAPVDAPDAALRELLRVLAARGYHFVTPTPASHARVVARPDRRVARSLTDVFGWNLPFDEEVVDDEIAGLLADADMLEPAGIHRRSRIRVSSLSGHLFCHSGFPTSDPNAVFLGPDSYRFADFIRAEISAGPATAGGVIVDIGAGAGVGGIVAAGLCPGSTILMTDINPAALRLARINAAHAGVAAEFAEADGLESLNGPFAVALANPPYIVDPRGRAYRDGGDLHGGRLSLDLAEAAAQRLQPGGRLLLYTGSAIVEGRDLLRDALAERMAAADCILSYREIDPDVFGEELSEPAYADVDRIAVVGAIAIRAG